MGATEQIYKAISTCWSDDVYLPDLSARSWRLTLQIISRYKTWLDAHLPDYVVKDAATAATTAGSAASIQPTASGLNLQRVCVLVHKLYCSSLKMIYLCTAPTD
jgi:hypothetical protein